MNHRISKWYYFTLLIIAIFFVTCRVEEYSDITIYGAKLNAKADPIGVDTEKPVFSWKLKSDKRNRWQSAYQIIVLDANTRDTCWNSGEIHSDNNIMVPYAGTPLKGVSRYLWKVRIRDQRGKVSRWSGENHFATGLMEETDWKGVWISSRDPAYSPFFTKEINMEKVPDEATVFVNCQGYFELYINGEKIGKDLLSPAVASDFRN